MTIELFHGSHQKITSFWHFSHFGTEQAAKDILRNKDKAGGYQSPRTAFIHHCRIHDVNVVQMSKDVGSPRPLTILRRLINDKSISFNSDPKKNHEEYMRIRSHALGLPTPRVSSNSPKLYLEEREYLAQILLKKKISIVEYCNNVEGSGDRSYVVIDPSLIQIIDTRTISSEET